MSKIKLLKQEDVIKIAAGEVIQRPANVVKELIENSIDAQAQNIIIKINQAGKKLIFIQDDGCGMSLEDAKLCILPHSTSKINSVDDLYNLSSFGFRGEALASIAAISNLEIQTKDLVLQSAIKLNFSAGKLINENLSSLAQGTSISVEDLFFNTPVRKIFLKTNDVESNQIWKTILNLGLSHTNITFKFYEDDKLVINAVGTNCLKERVAQFFDYHLAQNLIPIDFEKDGIKITGFTSNLQITRYNKNSVYLFINNRPFKDNKLVNAICNGYNQALPEQRFPVTFLKIETTTSQVDVNIHPTKEEVAFANHNKIYNCVKEAILTALETSVTHILGSQEIIADVNDDLKNSSVEPSATIMASKICIDPIPTQDINPSQTSFNTYKPIETSSINRNEITPAYNIRKNSSLNSLDSFQPLEQNALVPTIYTTDNRSSILQGIATTNDKLKIIGQLFSTYILFQNNNKLCMVDQHAASERIIYERLKNNFSEIPTIQILFPLVIDLPDTVIQIIVNIREIFKSFGICFEQIGKKTLIIDSLPKNFEASNLINFFTEIATLAEHETSTEIIRKKCFEHIHSHFACKTAIKAGDFLNYVAMKALLEELLNINNKFQCIHGRPTIFEIDKAEIEKWFMRR